MVNLTLLIFYSHLKIFEKKVDKNTFSSLKKQNKSKPALFLSISPNGKEMQSGSALQQTLSDTQTHTHPGLLAHPLCGPTGHPTPTWSP